MLIHIHIKPIFLPSLNILMGKNRERASTSTRKKTNKQIDIHSSHTIAIFWVCSYTHPDIDKTTLASHPSISHESGVDSRYLYIVNFAPPPTSLRHVQPSPHLVTPPHRILTSVAHRYFLTCTSLRMRPHTPRIRPHIPPLTPL